MIVFVLRRFAGFAATLLVASLVIFYLLDLLPGDPAQFILGINATPESVARLREQMGLNVPAPERFLSWIWGMVQGDFGMSYTQRAPVSQLIWDRLGVTIPLSLSAMGLSMLVGLPMGILAARKRGKAPDTAIMVLAQTGIAVPSFWFGMLLVLLFAVHLRWLPPGGFTPWHEDAGAAFRSLILPSLALALPQASILARVMRTALVDVTEQDFIRTARAKGLTMGEAVWRHGVRNALLPVLTILGLQFAFLIAGTIIVENVFYLPGLGKLLYTAILERDLILVRGGTIILIIAVTLTMLLTDLAYGLVDPRLREGSSA
ncbi:ABC transporter permease [Devosia neptuniae]|jgi:peptide/nickel transport system permease protein|uniref:ABC transporter permease n=1 Tax=Devosia TaxID=46913 RepID=UPI0022AF7B06|nr:ABC transporter permease [Devosia neptuniae]MCZ4344546.1 ABC transporter permease [Devosia neptuniae]|tara:strand:- start:4641 stop:5594 length:954 start_codon:yes stop_codon:yes gene_type:complete